jgi:hypothetical protein
MQYVFHISGNLSTGRPSPATQCKSLHGILRSLWLRKVAFLCFWQRNSKKRIFLSSPTTTYTNTNTLVFEIRYASYHYRNQPLPRPNKVHRNPTAQPSPLTKCIHTMPAGGQTALKKSCQPGGAYHPDTYLRRRQGSRLQDSDMATNQIIRHPSQRHQSRTTSAVVMKNHPSSWVWFVVLGC